MAKYYGPRIIEQCLEEMNNSTNNVCIDDVKDINIGQTVTGLKQEFLGEIEQLKQIKKQINKLYNEHAEMTAKFLDEMRQELQQNIIQELSY